MHTDAGYVLVSVTVVLLSILSAIVMVNRSYITKHQVDRHTNPIARTQLEMSARAHLQAYAAQNSCEGIQGGAISVNGTKDGYSYRLEWRKSNSGAVLIGEYTSATDSGDTWQSSASGVALYGPEQAVTWVLAPYFSEYAEIRHNKPSYHRDHRDQSSSRVERDKNIALRSFKPGPLLREPLQIQSARLELFKSNPSDLANPEELTLHAIRYPWDPKTVTDANPSTDSNPGWTLGSYDKFEALDTEVTELTDSITIDFTELLSSWVEGTRTPNGWALTTTSNRPTSWPSRPTRADTEFEQRPRLHINYRCECGEVCVGVDQTEVAALGTLTKVGGEGSSTSEDKRFIKLWLHRAHEDYLESTSGSRFWNRPHHVPAGLSSSAKIPGFPTGEDLTGLHIEPANDEHPDHHYYYVLDGRSIQPGNKTAAGNANDKLLVYYRSPADRPVGEAMEYRRSPQPSSPTLAAPIGLMSLFTSTDTFVGGFSYFDERYWFATRLSGINAIEDFPVEPDPTLPTSLHRRDTSRSQRPKTVLDYGDNIHTTDAVHAFDLNNFMISGEYLQGASGSTYESELGRWQFHDGELVVYNALTGRLRIIDREISRSDGNNVSAIAVYREPKPPAGSTEDTYEDAFPFLYE